MLHGRPGRTAPGARRATFGVWRPINTVEFFFLDLINYFGLNILTLINYLACEEVKFGPNLIKYFRGSWSKDFDFRPLLYMSYQYTNFLRQ